MSEVWDKIVVEGAKEHNLRNLTLEIPKEKITVITGLSGSGKSSLAFNTLHAEGQRRYMESLSGYVKQLVGQGKRPSIERISGLTPTIAIQQKTIGLGSHSTVGTVTEILDHVRLIFSKVAKAHCPHCEAPLSSQSVSAMTDQICRWPKGKKLMILAPMIRERKGGHQKILSALMAEGMTRILHNGVEQELHDRLRLSPKNLHTIQAVVDRLLLKDNIATRVQEGLTFALRLSGGSAEVLDMETKKIWNFSEKLFCPTCELSFPEPEPRLFSFNSPVGACTYCQGLGCGLCHGSRLRPEALAYTLQGLNIHELSTLSAEKTWHFFKSAQLPGFLQERVLPELLKRLSTMVQLGIGYLTLERRAPTLSGGESQRIQLTKQLGNDLVGVTYILDEPSIGLHPADHAAVFKSLRALVQAGNTVIMVEHDRDAMEQADHIIDLGPGAGPSGGRIVAEGHPKNLQTFGDSLTTAYLTGKASIPIPERKKADSFLKLKIPRVHTLKMKDFALPKGVLLGVTGVSGSGKSTFVFEALKPSLEKLGERVIHIDQSPIGRTPRSNPATYTGLYSPLRDLFASLPEARIRGFGVSRFSFNVAGGRCETCKGDGLLTIEMGFLPEAETECTACQGKRFTPEVLKIRFKGKSIMDALDMTIGEASVFFSSIPKIKRILDTLQQVGLDYLKLGQSATSFSGGEAQRIKLAKELGRPKLLPTIYLLDEPTTGLHFHDIRKLLSLLRLLRDQGHTIIVVEHQLDVIKSMDYLVDLGPGGGEEGGHMVAFGTPEDIKANKKSKTGLFLKDLF
jgi:excinuclease ABC subunit A